MPPYCSHDKFCRKDREGRSGSRTLLADKEFMAEKYAVELEILNNRRKKIRMRSLKRQKNYWGGGLAKSPLYYTSLTGMKGLSGLLPGASLKNTRSL